MTAKNAKHSVLIAGHPTSLSLEPDFWAALKKIADERHVSIAALITELDTQRGADPEAGNLSSYLRVFVLRALEAKLAHG